MSCQHNTVSRCHQCCSPIVVQVPGLQGTGIVWENCTEQEKKEIADTCLTPIQTKLDTDLAKMQEGVESCAASATAAKESEVNTQNLFNNSLLITGTSCYEETIVPKEDIPAGTEITIPNARQYIVGKYHLRAIYNGLQAALNYGLEEIGEAGDLSTKFKLTFGVKAGEELTIRVEALSQKVVDEAAQRYATQAGTYASQAEGYKNTIVDHQSDIILSVTNEGNYQIDRILGEVDNELVTNGVGGNEKFWVVPADIPAGNLIEIPGNVRYVVGRHHLHVSWNGMQLYLGQNFEEVGTEDTASYTFKLSFAVKLGDELDVKVSALGNKSADEAIALAGEASAAVAELSRKVVYKEETE